MTVSIPTLSDSAMLVYVRLSVWSARKLDKKQTLKVNKDASATSDAGRVNKHLLASADSKLRDVQRKANEIRDFIDTNTLPWDDAGNRIISNAAAISVVGQIQNLKTEFEALVDDFVAEYPVLRAQAVINLGDMGDDSDYPQPDVVRSKFSMRLSFSPLPTTFGDIRQGMSEQQAAAWQQHFEGNVKVQVNSALLAAWERLKVSLERYSDRLRLKDDGSGKMEIFRDTMVTQLRETCALLGSLNVFGDKELESIVRTVQTDIASFEPEALRTNLTTAVTVKGDVDEILERMRGYLNA